MLYPVQLENMIVAEIAETDITMVGLLTGVGARMDFKLFGASESLATALDWAFIGFLASMGSHVND